MERKTNADRKNLQLYAITDSHWLNGRTLYSVVKESLEGGVTFLQLREKELDEEHFLEEARELQKLCREYQVPFVINDNVDIAAAINADGVHVGQSDMEAGDVRAKLGPNKIIGVTAKTVEQAVLAQERGADYLGVGAVFHTDSKADAKEISFDTLKDICKAVSIPVIAIGGITEENVRELAGSGICGIAVISAIYAQRDIKKAAENLKNETCRMLAAEITEEKNIKAGKIKMRKTALTIAGSDSSGGAGIQADIKTMMANGVYAMSAITALTAQNTTGVSAIFNATPEFLEQELDSVFTDIFPDAVKIGMVSDRELISVIARKLKEYQARNIVVDPVMVATSGARLISEDAVDTLKQELFPLAAVLTPNIPEAEVLTGMKICTGEDMIEAARQIAQQYQCAVLCKGGHQLNDANDLLYFKDGYRWFEGKRIDNPNTHGTGCTLSSAIAANLAKGYDLPTSVERAKDYISGALSAMLDLGAGSGPMDHGFAITGKYVQ